MYQYGLAQTENNSTDNEKPQTWQRCGEKRMRTPRTRQYIVCVHIQKITRLQVRDVHTAGVDATLVPALYFVAADTSKSLFYLIIFQGNSSFDLVTKYIFRKPQKEYGFH